MIITIVGTGGGGCALACKLKEKGHEVRLLKTSRALNDENFEEVYKNNGINCIDNTKNSKKTFFKFDLITRDLKKGVSEANIVIIVIQSLYHKELAKKIAPYFEKDQLVLVMPGYMGSLYFKNNSREKDIIFAEGESLPYDARITEKGTVNILFENVRNPVAFLPALKSDAGTKILKNIQENITLRKNIIESALHNPNLIVHTIGAIMSAGRIEFSKGEFWMYREAFTPSIWNLVHDLDNEKIKILEKLDLPKQTFADSFKHRTFENLSEDSLTAFKNYAKEGSPKGPNTVDHRYICEDVPMGLCLMKSLGQKLDVKTPVCDSLINIASSLLKKNFLEQGRTIEDLEITTEFEVLK